MCSTPLIRLSTADNTSVVVCGLNQVSCVPRTIIYVWLVQMVVEFSQNDAPTLAGSVRVRLSTSSLFLVTLKTQLLCGIFFGIGLNVCSMRWYLLCLG